MQKTISFDNTEGLAAILRDCYAIPVGSVRKLRDWIGYVYLAEGEEGRRYVLKVYRHFHTRHALDTIPILKYLAEQGFPAARIVDTRNASPSILIETPDGVSVAILYEYIAGDEVDGDAELLQIAEQAGVLHSLMDSYAGTRISHGKTHFIDRYLTQLEALGFPAEKLADLRAYGDELWHRFSLSTPGFCHGDLHSGNMLRDGQGAYWLFDFDSACFAHPVADIAVMSDTTDYFVFRETDYDETARNLDRFLAGYGKRRNPSAYDLRTVYDFIAIRHFDIQATIMACQGHDIAMLEDQHAWLMRWRNLCARRSGSIS